MLKNIELAVGEKMVVYEKVVIVFGRTEKRIYNLKGVLIGKSVCDEHKNVNDFCIFFSNCIAIKENAGWKLLDYEGNVLYSEKTFQIEKCFQNKNWFKLIESAKSVEDFVGAIYSNDGECILQYGEHKGLRIYGETLIVDNKILDVKSKKYIGKKWEAIEHFRGFSIVKDNDEYYVYNHYTQKIEMQIDAYIREYPFVKVYRNNFCGLLINLKRGNHIKFVYGYQEYIVLSISYKKIVIDGNYVFAYSKEGMEEKYNKDQLSIQKEEKQESNNDEDASRKLTEIEFFEEITLKEGDEIERYEKFFVVRKVAQLEQDRIFTEYLYYTIDGKFIGKSGSIVFENRDEEEESKPNFIATSKWLALGGYQYLSIFSRRDYNSGWLFYNYDGTKAFDFEIGQIKIENGYYILMSSDKSEILVLDKDGNTLWSIKGNYKSVELLENQYFIVITENSSDPIEALTIYDLNGKNIFGKEFKKSHIKGFIGNIFFYEEANNLFECDMTTGKMISVAIDNIERMTLKKSCEEMCLFKRNGMVGLYEYMVERSENDKFLSFKEMIPIKYKKIIDGINYFCAEADDGEDIYDYTGKLITTTRS